MAQTSQRMTHRWSLVMLTVCTAGVAAMLWTRHVPGLGEAIVPSQNGATGPAGQSPAVNGGWAIVGDSNSDEYRADDNRGGAYSTTTLNWMEQLVRSRNLDFGSWGTRSEPRRTGYEYNWARSGATAASMIASGQHTGLAQQVANGQVQYVIVFIGINDFHLLNGTYAEIYDGTLSGAALQAKIDGIIEAITTAVDTILDAGEVQMVLANYGDPGVTPEAMVRFPDPVGRQRVTDAINAVNSGLEAMATTRGVVIADVAAFGSTLFDRLDDQGRLHVGGELIDVVTKGNEPHHGRLDDPAGHGGTVLSGLMANELFINPLNNVYGLGITPLSDQEILRNAGIGRSWRLFLPIMLLCLATLVGAVLVLRQRPRLWDGLKRSVRA